MLNTPFAALLLTAAALPAIPAPAPSEIVAAAPASDWSAIAASDMLVMDIAADAKGKPRRVVIQMMPPPFSQGWIGNIRKLATAHWWDGLSINRVQDNYVVQWGDASEKKALPAGLVTVGESEYVFNANALSVNPFPDPDKLSEAERAVMAIADGVENMAEPVSQLSHSEFYAAYSGFEKGWPIASDWTVAWPVHCYGMVGVGRNLSPDTGSGAELYTVIGHAPRHLDRNIALVGRVIEGIEHLSSLPRGTGALGFYETEEEQLNQITVIVDESNPFGEISQEDADFTALRVPILSLRMGTEITDQPKFEYLSTESTSFAKYADARANRRDPFFIRPAGGVDICNIPVPVRRVR